MRALKIPALTVLAAALLIGGTSWLFSDVPIFGLPPLKTSAPEGFDAERYPDLSALTSTDRAEVLNLDDYGTPLFGYLLPDGAGARFTLHSKAGQNREVLVDRTGTVIGTITEESPISSLGSYMVTPDAFYSITGSGISDRLPMEVLATVGKPELERMIGESALYTSFAPTALPADNVDRAAGRWIHVMQHNGSWKRAASSDLAYHDRKGVAYENLAEADQIYRPVEPDRNKTLFGGRYRVELTHFDQQQYLAPRGPGWGSTTGTGRPAQWIGTGYYTVHIDNVPALRFRIPQDREFLSQYRGTRLVVAGGATLDFIVLILTDDKNWNDMIVVRGR